MELVILFALAGGLFSVLTFIHFFVDWICQTHAEAMAKHNNAKVRARHCLIYTLGFVPLLLTFTYVGALTLLELSICLLILFVSHFYLDTYHGVYLWAKYIRRPPEMDQADTRQGFIQFVQTTLGKILMISIDQISHLFFLWPIVYMVLKHLH
jgi:hypothetical protein